MRLLLFTLTTLTFTSLFSQGDSLRMAQLANVQGMPGGEYNDCWGYTDSNGAEYALIGSRRAINIYDVSECNNPVEVATIVDGCNTIWRDIKTYDSFVYAVSESCNEGLIIVDMDEIAADPNAWTQSTTDFNTAHNIYIDIPNGRLYVVGAKKSGFNINILVYDVATDPAVPVLLYNGPLAGGYIHDIYVRDNIAYASHGSSGYYAYDFTDMSNIVDLGSLDTNYGYNHSSWLTEDGTYAFICFETRGRQMKVFEIVRSDTNSDGVDDTYQFIDRLTFHDPLEPNTSDIIAHNPFIKGDSLYISYYQDGIQIFDVSNPLIPTKASYYDTYLANNNSDLYTGFNGAWGTYPFFDSGCIVVSDIETGLYTLNTLLSQSEGTADEYYVGTNDILFMDNAGVVHKLDVDVFGNVQVAVVPAPVVGIEFKDSDFEIKSSAKGIIFDGAFGSFWRIRLDASGNFTKDAISTLPTSGLIRTEGNTLFANPNSGLVLTNAAGIRQKVNVDTNNNLIIVGYPY